MSAGAKGAWKVSDELTAVLQGQLERAVTGDAEARLLLLELTRDRLMRHARRLLHGQYARLEPVAQNDDVVQQLYLKVLRNRGPRPSLPTAGSGSSCPRTGRRPR